MLTAGKYVEEMRVLELTRQKFFDKLYPPGGAALYYHKKQADSYQNIRWMRISEIFEGKNPVLLQSSGIDIRISTGKLYLTQTHFREAANSDILRLVSQL